MCKYVNKVPEKAKSIFEHINRNVDAPTNDETKDIDEIKEYLDCRYICEQDAMWRLLGFDIHYHWPPIERLHVYLPFMNIITLQKNAKLKAIIVDPKNKKQCLQNGLKKTKLAKKLEISHVVTFH